MHYAEHRCDQDQNGLILKKMKILKSYKKLSLPLDRPSQVRISGPPHSVVWGAADHAVILYK